MRPCHSGRPEVPTAPGGWTAAAGGLRGACLRRAARAAAAKTRPVKQCEWQEDYTIALNVLH